MEKKKKLTKKILIGGLIVGLVSIIPIAAVACGSSNNSSSNNPSNNNSNEVNLPELISKVESSIKVNTEATTISPSSLTNENIIQYITLQMPPSNVTYSYLVSTPNDVNGSIDLQVQITTGTSSQKTTMMTINGFQTTTQYLADLATVSSIVNNINLADEQKKIILKNGAILPSQITSNNIDQYIIGIPPAPEGVTYEFSLAPKNAFGTIDILITVIKNTALDNSNTITIQGLQELS